MTWKKQPPEMIEIEPINMCNLRCEVCERGSPSYNQKPIRFLTFKEFKKIIDSYDYPIKKIQFCGTCEPLLNPDLIKMIGYVKKKKKPEIIDIIINATLLSRETAEKIIRAGITSLEASVDGADERTYGQIRHYSFKKLKGNLIVFGKLAKKHRVRFGINCVINKINLKTLKNMPGFAKSVGTDVIEFRIYETNISRNDLAIHNRKKLGRIKKYLFRECKKIGIEFKLFDNGNETCKLNKEANINSYSFLTPCYHLSCYNIIMVGKRKFSSIWKSKEVTKLLDKINKERLLKECCCLKAIKMRGKTGRK